MESDAPLASAVPAASPKDGRGERPSRVLVVIDHAAQHFSPAFRALSRNPAVNLLVVYGRTPGGEHFDPGFGRTVAWDIDLLGGYDWTTGDPIAEIGRFSPDVIVVFGWSRPVARRILLAAVRSKSIADRVFVYGDTTWQGNSNPKLRPLRSVAPRALFARIRGAVSTGTFNRDFYVTHGMRPSSIWEGVCPADIDHYRAPEGPPRPESRFLYAGKFVQRKGVDVLLRACLALGEECDWSLTLAGDGPLRDELRELVAGAQVEDRIDFRGFVNQSELPSLMSRHDFLVVPSTRDLRVLVVLEGMAAGLIPIVSDATAIWGPNDVVCHGKTGFVFPSGDSTALATLMSVHAGEDLSEIRSACREVAERHRPEVLASRVAELAKAVRSRTFPLPGA